MGIQRRAASVAIASLLWAPSLQAKECDPPQKMCGDDPYTFACPPCAPKAASSDRVVAEDFRVSLEDYRKGLENARVTKEASLPGYRAGIGKYKEGMQTYQGAVAAASRE